MIRRASLIAVLALHACAADSDSTSPSVRFAGAGEPCSDGACVTEGLHVGEVDGITVLHRKLPGSPVAAVEIAFDGGAARWSPGNVYAESVAFRLINWWGSSRHPGVWEQKLAEIGASFGAGSGLDYAWYSMAAPAVHFDRAFELLAASVLEPPFHNLDEEQDLDHVKATFRHEAESALDEAATAASRTAWSTLTANHPYGARSNPNGADSVRVTDLIAALDDMARKSKMTVAVVGDLDEAAVHRAIARHFARLPEGGARAVPSLARLAPAAWSSVILAYPQAPAFHITGYFPAPWPLDGDYAALLLGLRVLSSRLFDQVRIDRGLVYSIGAGATNLRANYGWLTLSSVAPAEAMAAVHAVVDELLQGGIDEAELASERALYRTSFYEGTGTAGGLAGGLLDWHVTTGGQLSADDLFARIEAVTAEDARAALAQYLPAIRYAAAGPDSLPLDVAALDGASDTPAASR